MEAKELRQKPKKDLMRLLSERRERLRALRFDLSQGKLKDPTEIKRARKDIARILTLLKDLKT